MTLSEIIPRAWSTDESQAIRFRAGDAGVVDGHEGRLEEIGVLSSLLVTPQASGSVPDSRLVGQTLEIRSNRGGAPK